MKILILEDAEKRIQVFREMFKGHNLHITGEPKEAIDLLKRHQWDMLFLDHDLYGKIHVPSGDGTGWEVAKWLSNNRTFLPTKVYLHSHNEKGVKEMRNVLPQSKIASFGTFRFNGTDIETIPSMLV